MSEIKYWWSEDHKWFCIFVDDGVSKATASLTPQEAKFLSEKVAYQPQPIETSPPTQKILMWRADRKLWEIGIVAPDFIGNQEYAYTHWLPLPPSLTAAQ